MRILFLISFVVINIFKLYGQEIAIVKGTVRDELGEGLAYVSVILMIDGKEKGMVTAEADGVYKMTVPANVPFSLLFSYVGYTRVETNKIRLNTNELYKFDVALKESSSLAIVEVEAKREQDAQIIRREDIQTIASTTMNLESMLQFLAAGVVAGTGGELTSQYSVRGGNYDENLIYVNGFEVYRPLLVRASQQEGLTFPNPDMLDNLSFSNGGFKAQYGDKMSSVLDVQYRRPTRKLEGSAGVSLLGGQVYLGGAKYLDVSRRLTYTLGARYKSNQYLLNSQAIKGEYAPRFVDVQSNIIYDLTKRIQLEFLGNYSSSRFSLIPRDGRNSIGTYAYALELYSKFQGQELDDFQTSMLGVSTAFASDTKTGVRQDSAQTITSSRHRIMASYYQSYENERIDRLAEYWLSQVDVNLGSESFGEPTATLGYGMTHLFARNYLSIHVANLEYRGVFSHNIYKNPDGKNGKPSTEYQNLLQWGIGYKNERVNDDLKEWTRYDSLYYTVPFDTSQIITTDYLRTNVQLNMHRFQGFIQHSWKYISPAHQLEVIGGVRGNYWTLNNELLISPRVQIFYTPRRFSNPLSDSTTRTKDLTFKLCGGAYNQPPFYRELRDLLGNVHTDVKAQRSWQGLAGVIWDFVAWKRRFKFISELYYKYQYNMIAYDVENVRIRYYGNNNLSGYVMGWDFRLNGELVKGLESWVNLSFMRARERFDGVQHKRRETGDDGSLDTILVSSVPKPTDQLMVVSMFFQDNFPKAEWAQVNMTLTVGTGMPFGVPRNNIEYRNTYRYMPYHRIDLGFSFMLWNQKQHIKKYFDNDKEQFMNKEKNWLRRSLRTGWLSVEIFNLMQAVNQSSYNWIRTFDGGYYGIPNTLTSRRINLRFRIEF